MEMANVRNSGVGFQDCKTSQKPQMLMMSCDLILNVCLQQNK